MSVLRLLETRATKASTNPQNPAYWVAKLFGGGEDTGSGITVDEDSALNFSAVWNAVNIIAGAVGYLPMMVYRKTERGKERADKDPVFWLLHDRPNDYMDALTFRETLQGHALTWGNGYAEIERDGASRPIALWPLPPNRVEPTIVNQRLIYRYAPANGPVVDLPYDDVFHVKGLSFDGLKGYSPIRRARESIGLGIACEKFGASFFGNGAWMGGLVVHPGKLSAQAQTNLRESLNTEHQGVGKANRIAVLQEGMTYHKTGVAPEEAQFLQTRRFGVEEIARWFDLPPHMLKDTERATFNNIEHQGIEFVTRTLVKWLRRWELEANYKLFSDSRQGSYFAEFKVDALLRGDIKTRMEAYNSGIQSGIFTRNEVRDWENLNPIDGLDDPLQPLNMVKVGEKPPEPAPPPKPAPEPKPEDKGARNLAPLYESAAARIVGKQVRAIRKALKHPENMPAFLAEFWPAHTAYARNLLVPTFTAAGQHPEDGGIALDDFLAECRSDLGMAPDGTQGPVDAGRMEAVLAEWESTGVAQLAGGLQNA